MSQRRPLVAANWKMNGTLASLRPLVDDIIAGLDTRSEIALCPPAIYLAEVAGRIANTDIALGAQTLSEHSSGAYTGEVSAAMLNDYNCRFAIVGHSERRSLYAEGDIAVARKFQAAHLAGIKPILCVGETLAEREAGETEVVIGRQLDAVTAVCESPDDFAGGVIAYEPVWAIGTGHTASPEQAQAVHEYIRGRLDRAFDGLGAVTRILYGGSVKADNAEELFAMTDIDGGLIGGASLDSQAFLAICHATR